MRILNLTVNEFYQMAFEAIQPDERGSINQYLAIELGNTLNPTLPNLVFFDDDGEGWNIFCDSELLQDRFTTWHITGGIPVVGDTINYNPTQIQKSDLQKRNLLFTGVRSKEDPNILFGTVEIGINSSEDIKGITLLAGGVKPTPHSNVYQVELALLVPTHLQYKAGEAIFSCNTGKREKRSAKHFVEPYEIRGWLGLV